MKVRPAKPFFLEGGTRAVLLLHAFTGSSADVRQLGRFLNKRGYTCYAPHYRGHAVPPEELLKTDPNQWWQDVCEAYDFLSRSGYDRIAVGGLSLGGVFSLKSGYTLPVRGIFPMCAPIDPGNKRKLIAGATQYAEKYYRLFQGLSGKLLDRKTSDFEERIVEVVDMLGSCIVEVRRHLHEIDVPACVIQGRLDEMVDPDAAAVIFKGIYSDRKQIKWYEKSTHVITLGAEKEQVYQDIYAFLESLDWSGS